MVERIWVEINARVNYPIKEVLVDMLERGDFSLDAEWHKFCVSWFVIQVASTGIELFVAAWNDHPIPGIMLKLIYCLLHFTSYKAWTTAWSTKGVHEEQQQS